MEYLFESKEAYYKTPYGAVKEETDVIFRVGINQRHTIQEVYLRLRSEDGLSFNIKGHWVEMKPDHNIYQFHWKAKDIGLYFYFFETHFQDDGWDAGKSHQLSVYKKDYETPEWLKGGLMYQIFPDRFERDPRYQPPQMAKDCIIRQDWGGLPNYMPNGQGEILNNDFFAGNLSGIRRKLPYLKELGVTVIYLNPIVEAYSNHRYDTGHFKKIDPLLGTLDDFKALCLESREQGIRIILDGVFNHTGSDSLYFNRENHYPEIGAYQSQNSAYSSWYHFTGYPDQYDAWWGITTLPQVNELDESYLNYILRDDDAVVKFWMRLGASGFRLDVADELPSAFLVELRRTVKAMDKNAAIIGEVWENASNKISYGKRRKYFLGEELDSVMNYPIKDALIRFAAREKNAENLSSVIEELREDYPEQVFNSLMNMLGTHDTARILTILGMDEAELRNCNKGQKAALSLSSEQLVTARKRLYCMLILWAFLPGIPCIYYGDEIGMQGAEDPFNRGCFDLGHADAELSEYYRKLLSFRNEISEINHYAYRPELARNSLFAFNRVFEDRRIVVVVNSGQKEESIEIEDLGAMMKGNSFINGDIAFGGEGVVRIGPSSGFVLFGTA